MATREGIERLGIGDVVKRLGRDRTTVARWISNGSFPAPHYIGTRRAWFLHEVEAWERTEMARPASGRKFNLPTPRGETRVLDAP